MIYILAINEHKIYCSSFEIAQSMLEKYKKNTRNRAFVTVIEDSAVAYKTSLGWEEHIVSCRIYEQKLDDPGYLSKMME